MYILCMYVCVYIYIYIYCYLYIYIYTHICLDLSICVVPGGDHLGRRER